MTTLVVNTAAYDPVFGTDERLLDDMPASILSAVNRTTYTGYNEAPVCDGLPGAIVLPMIPERCTMKWTIGAEMARGTSAVVFRTRENRHVIRVLQLDRKKGGRPDKRFRRDVHARLLLACLLRDVPLTPGHMAIGVDVAVDAFICEHHSRRYGILIAHQADSTALQHLVSIPTVQDRHEFMVRVADGLDRLLDVLHVNGMAHCDLHHGNILYHAATDMITLTDFESAIGSTFDTDPRVLSAYIHNETSDVVCAEMECVHRFLQGHGKPDWDSLTDYGITKAMLLALRKTYCH